MGTIQTTSYDRTGKMLKNKIQYYEGSSETSYDYIGNCVRRIYSSRGYSEVSELIDVHFPDQNCNDSQIINYGDGKVIGRTVLSMSGNILTEKHSSRIIHSHPRRRQSAHQVSLNAVGMK